jgi:hypothetical protein
MPYIPPDSEEALEGTTIRLFEQLGWEAANCYHETFGLVSMLGRETTEQVVLEQRLRAAIEKLNPGLSPNALEIAVDELVKDRSTLDQNFRFGFLPPSIVHPTGLVGAAFSPPIPPQRLRRPTRGPASPPPGSGKPGSASFQAISHTPLRPPSFLRPVCFLAAAPYPLGSGNAAIRRTIAPKSRRVK